MGAVTHIFHYLMTGPWQNLEAQLALVTTLQRFDLGQQS